MSNTMIRNLMCFSASLILNTSLYSETSSSQLNNAGFIIRAGQELVWTNSYKENGITATCKLSIDKNKRTLMVATVINPTFSVDGQNIEKNRSLSRIVQNGSLVKLSASYKASMRFRNQGSEDVVAFCYNN